MEITNFGKKNLQKPSGQFLIKIAYYLSAFVVSVLWSVGISPSIANANNAATSGNNAASSSIQSATQTTSNALSSIILGNTMGGSGGFKLKLGSAPQLNHFSVIDKNDNNQTSGFTIYFEEYATSLTQQKELLDFFTLLSNIGGTAGIFMGVSFLSFMEVFAFCIKIFIKMMNKQAE